MRLLNVIVLYDNYEEVCRYIREVAEISEGLVDIAVVINRDTQQKKQSLSELLETTGCGRVIDYGQNVGYLNALLKTVQDTDPETYDYFVLSNTDIHYEMKDFFRKLAEKRYPEDIGCIAPSVFSTKISNYQNPHYLERVPEEKIRFLIRVFRHPALGRLYLKLAGLKGEQKYRQKPESCYVYSPNGSYMIFSKAFIHRIRGYLYGVTLYSEEACIGELLLRHGMKCWYDDSVEVIHQESTVTGKMDYRKRFSAWSESLEYILKEFYLQDDTCSGEQ